MVRLGGGAAGRDVARVSLDDLGATVAETPAYLRRRPSLYRRGTTAGRAAHMAGCWVPPSSSPSPRGNREARIDGIVPGVPR